MIPILFWTIWYGTPVFVVWLVLFGRPLDYILQWGVQFFVSTSYVWKKFGKSSCYSRCFWLQWLSIRFSAGEYNKNQSDCTFCSANIVLNLFSFIKSILKKTGLFHVQIMLSFISVHCVLRACQWCAPVCLYYWHLCVVGLFKCLHILQVCPADRPFSYFCFSSLSFLTNPLVPLHPCCPW